MGNLLFLLLLLGQGQLAAQSFSNTGSAIPDYGNAKSFLLNVPALDSPQLNARFGLKQVCLHIQHPKVSQLAIFLMAPDGTQLELVSGAGGGGANFSNTCFDMKATTTIVSGSAPFTGYFYPRQNIGQVNNGQAGIGIWRLLVQDVVLGDSGLLQNWSLKFDTNAPVPLGTPVGNCHLFNAPGCACPDSLLQTCLLIPDILIGETWFTDTLRMQEYRDSFTVSNSTANIGWGPMEIIGTNQWFCGDTLVNGNVLCSDGKYSRQQVKQRLYKKTSNGFFDFEDTVVGYIRFHSELGHRHLHVEDWVENTLRIRGPESDPALWKIVGRGTKVSVSLYDHVGCSDIFKACDYEGFTYNRDSLRNGGLGAGYAVGGEQVQGISVGYADIYENLLPFGQAVYFDSLCNGDYYLVAQYDPQHRFVDFNRSNNTTISLVTLTKQRPNCCAAKFDVDTIEWEQGIFRFIDRSQAMPATWKWIFSDGDSSAQQFPFHQFTKGGSQSVTLKTSTAQGCSAEQNFSLQLPVNLSVANLESEAWQVQLSPNPNHQNFSLQFSSKSNQLIQVELFDFLGRKKENIASNFLLHDGNTTLPFQVDTTGVFLVKVSAGNSFRILKLVTE